jgi:hypothetical protein
MSLGHLTALAPHSHAPAGSHRRLKHRNPAPSLSSPCLPACLHSCLPVSLCHCVTESLCRCVTVSLSHCVAPSPLFARRSHVRCQRRGPRSGQASGRRPTEPHRPEGGRTAPSPAAVFPPSTTQPSTTTTPAAPSSPADRTSVASPLFARRSHVRCQWRALRPPLESGPSSFLARRAHARCQPPLRPQIARSLPMAGASPATGKRPLLLPRPQGARALPGAPRVFEQAPGTRPM